MKIGSGKTGFDFDGVMTDAMAVFIRLAAEDYFIKVSPDEITE